MTGIERLRELAGGINPRSVWSVTCEEYDNAHGLDVDHKGGQLRDLLADIADQIERELTCDEDTIENVRLIVGGVVDDMERHVSGVEGAEDSPVARWARELRRALKSDTSDSADTQNPSCADAAETADVSSEVAKVTRDPADDVSMSAYDLLPQEERDAIAWVRERGGLGAVKEEWKLRSPIPATCVTHAKPERPDSWERLEEDAEKNPCDYFGFDGEETCGRCPASGKNCEQTMALDIVRRARALAERERGE